MPPDKDKDIAERVAVLESKMDTIQTVLERIEKKLDETLDNHEHRLTKVEAEFSLFKRVGSVLWGIIYAAIAGAIGLFLKKS